MMTELMMAQLSNHLCKASISESWTSTPFIRSRIWSVFINQHPLASRAEKWVFDREFCLKREVMALHLPPSDSHRQQHQNLLPAFHSDASVFAFHNKDV